MAIYGCSGDHGKFPTIMRWDIPADGQNGKGDPAPLFSKFYAGCLECGEIYCRPCFDSQIGKCPLGHELTVGKYHFKPLPDWDGKMSDL